MTKKIPSLHNEERHFIETVWDYYRVSGRHQLPWRKTCDPYKILVSEIMLQQTQVSRVIPKYREFLKQFPTARQLAAAPLGDVLKIWQGLGYNRRAKFLKQAAEIVVANCKSSFPKTLEELRALPGVGGYTAGAIMNFAYNVSVPLVETNIRTVYIHHFFQNKEKVSDAELLEIIKRTFDEENPRVWNWALMDYGMHLKQSIGNVSKRSSVYQKQSPFSGSDRFIRGALLRILSKGTTSQKKLISEIAQDPERIIAQIEILLDEGLVVKKGSRLSLPY